MPQKAVEPCASAATKTVEAKPRAPLGSGLAGGLFLLTVMGASWGITIPLSKIAVTAGAHPLGLAFWQGAIGGGFLLAICLLRRQPPPLGRQDLIFYIFCGILGSVLPGSLLFWVAIYLPAGVISIAIACVPLFTYGLAIVLQIEAPVARRLAGVALGLVAVALMTLPESGLPKAGLSVWVLIALLACGSYALENVFISLRKPPQMDAIAATSGLLLMAAVLMLPLVLSNDAWVPLGLPFGPREWAIVAMAIASAVAYSLFVYVVAVAGPIFASQAAYLVTIFGVIWGIALLNEHHSVWVWSALLVMLLGLSLVQPRRREVDEAPLP